MMNLMKPNQSSYSEEERELIQNEQTPLENIISEEKVQLSKLNGGLNDNKQQIESNSDKQNNAVQKPQLSAKNRNNLLKFAKNARQINPQLKKNSGYDNGAMIENSSNNTKTDVRNGYIHLKPSQESENTIEENKQFSKNDNNSSVESKLNSDPETKKPTPTRKISRLARTASKNKMMPLPFNLNDDDDDQTSERLARTARNVKNVNSAVQYMASQSLKHKIKDRMRDVYAGERLTIKQIFSRYVETSTLHGFVYTCSDTHIVRRIIWALLMILGAIYFLIKLKEGIIEYFSYPFTTLSTMEYVDATLPFPAISICLVNQFRQSKINNSSLYKLYEDQRLPLNRNWSDPGYDIEGEELKSEYENISLRIHDIFKECDWLKRATEHPTLAGNNCSSKNFTSYFSENGQACFTLNSGAKGHEKLAVDMAGLKDGYELLFDLHNGDVIPYNDYTGLEIIIHDQETPPARDTGILISPGFKTYVNLERTETENLPPPYDTKCGEVKLNYFEKYNRKACLIERLTDYITERCGCREFFMPDSYNEFEMHKSCPIDCQVIQYNVKVTETRFLHNPPIGIERSIIEENFKKKNFSSYVLHLHSKMNHTHLGHYVKENVIQVIFFFGEMNKVKNIQEATFSFYKFLGNMGGDIGLMLGASLLTFVEFIDLFIFIFYHQLLRLSKAHKNEEKESIEMSTKT